jgi:carboxypeptidase T
MRSTSRVRLTVAAAMTAAAALLFSPLPGVFGSAPQAAAESEKLYVYRVPATGKAADKLLSKGFDVLETRDGDDLFVLGDEAEKTRLKAAGFRPTVDRQFTPPTWQAPRPQANALEETYYGGYRTVNAHWAHLGQVAQDHPSLAQVVTYGQSWRKQNGNPRGYDLKAVCITKRNSGDCAQSTTAPKPRFFLMAQVHARELTTGEVAYRFIDYLTDNYGTSSEVTSLLDTTEVWVVPIGNPDGVDIVQSGGSNPPLQRKNANTSNGTCSVPNVGVDLNRNNGSHWGESGSTTQPCGETYRGPRADSEPENVAYQNLIRKLFPDKRDGDPTVGAPANTRGLLISMHSYADMVLFPWAYNSGVKTGNDAKLRELARDMANLMGYRYGQPGEILYNASGSHDDWSYDQLGVASFTFEIGPQSGSCSGFLPSYSCQESFWTEVRPALMYAARKASNPYGGVVDPDPDPDPGTGLFTNDNDVQIADRATVESPITVSGRTGNAPSTLKVNVAIKHTYRGDLQIDVLAPDGTAYRVKNAGWDSADDVNATYTVDASSETANGTWKLRVADVYSGDTGYIDSWSLQF